MFKYILYFLAVYAVLAAIIVLLNIFDILPSSLENKFNIAVTIASICLPAHKFVKKFERVPNRKESLIFAFGATFISETIGLLFSIFLLFDINLEILLLLAFLLMVKFLIIFWFFGYFGKLFLQGINKK
ncbi:MAG: ABZJ_00895 family protein [Campylobacteraceae bacterium]|jgi:hypothetical protein|nr:ABZJ_00895 family protein [Campylobacteraceae bacterium]